ncbi:cytochrome b5 domain-containing protein [Candidatus Woesearchaeota archaeon]|nr:cytochrome b5 domain-containing protein [Candidatus Woesearchaeota archaeon]
MDDKIFFGLLASLILFLFLTGCAGKPADANQPEQQNQQVSGQQQPTGQETEEPIAKTYTLEEVAKHSTKEDCWLLISGKVYDVTKYIGSHPGGQAIVQGCGKDATELFETRPMGSGTPHSERARANLDKYYIGEVE